MSSSAQLRLAFVVLLFASGCFKVDIENGSLRCALDGKCPTGYACATDGVCWKNGTGPNSGADLAGADLTSGGAVDLLGADLTGGGADGGGGSDGGAGNKQNGDACGANGECVSGFCVDGFCCNTACDGSCVACNLTGAHGACSVLADGEPPRAGHASCGPDAKSTCQRDGACDGQGACRLWDDSTECKPSSCDPGTNTGTNASRCDGAGTCVTPNSVVCTPFACNSTNTACNATCNGIGDCKAPATCVSMSCGTKPDGASCSSSTECTNGHCVDGTCCNSECNGKCQACDLPTALGVCSQVTSGQPHGTRGDCAGKGTTCGGTCTASSAMACTFPGAAASCGMQSCSAGTQTNQGSCNGAGACSAGGTTPCGNYKCNGAGTMCITSCTADTDCASARYCNADATCKTTKPNGRMCSGSTECTSGNCIDGYCCDTSCAGNCGACNLPGSLGTCKAIASGATPVGSRSCPGTNLNCAGFCNGSSLACQFPSVADSCVTGSCTPGNATTAATAIPPRKCDGAGNCSAAGASLSCGAYQCNSGNTACRTTCSDNVHCTTLGGDGAATCNTTTMTCACFAAGTAVQTPDGARAIETFAAGDEVLAFDVRDGKLVTKKVVALEVKHAPGLVRLAFGGETITTTPDHYFWVDGTQWVRAVELRIGDAMRKPSGERSILGAIESLPLPPGGDDRVYNLLVEDVETYFVGTSPILTHSCTTLSFSAHARPPETP